MADGFLGYKTSFMLDLVVCALVAVVPVLLYSIYIVKYKHRFALHKTLQLVLAAALVLTVLAFEVDLHLIQGGWENIVAKRDVPLTKEAFSFVRTLLTIHLIFAGSTPVLWGITIAYALKRFPSPPAPGDHSPLHKKLAWASTIDLTLTSVTGLIFYYFAFVA
ncbi:MAG: DUF420 domain-containing protein [Planctomycetaceae bacterium]|nr:DUF420 domain-containing protein [Planctomycetaceae bacterium]